jgi:hypothetical protein
MGGGAFVFARLFCFCNGFLRGMERKLEFLQWEQRLDGGLIDV